MEPCRWKFEQIMLRSISKQQKQEIFHTRLINFLVFRNYRDIDFALRCMHAQISMNWNFMLNFVKLKQRIFKRLSSSYWPTVWVGDSEKF